MDREKLFKSGLFAFVFIGIVLFLTLFGGGIYSTTAAGIPAASNTSNPTGSVYFATTNKVTGTVSITRCAAAGVCSLISIGGPRN
jgi:hypothetical protein